MITNSIYKKYYNIEFDDSQFTTIKLDENGPEDISNYILLPYELAERYRDFVWNCKQSTMGMSFSSRSLYYSKLSKLFYDMSVWQICKENEDLRKVNPELDCNGLGYEDFRD